MSTIRDNSPSLSPCSAHHDPPKPPCTCHSFGSIEEFPFLHRLVDHARQNYLMYFLTLICQMAYFVSLILPRFVRRPLVVVLSWLDNIYTLLGCYLEHAWPRINHRLWGSAPGSCCQHKIKQATGRLSWAAGMYLQEVSKSRLGSLFASISIHADEDIAEILRMIADTYGDVVDRLLPPSYTFVESDLVRGDDLVAEKEFNRSLGTPSFGTDLINIGSEPIERSRIGSGNPRSESDHLRELEVSMGFRSETLHPDITTSPLEYDSRSDQVDIFNDEGYVSDDEATIIRGYANQQLVGQTQLSQIDSGPLLPMGPANGDLVFEVSPSATPETTTPPVQKLRSLLKPPSSAHMHNIVRTQSDPNLQIVLDPTMRGLFMELEAPWIDIAGRQAPYEMTAFPNSSPILLEPWVTRHQSSWHWETSSSPNTVSFDDIPGLRRESQSIREVQRLVTISADAVGRAHHHWLRPCTACARKAVAEKKEKEFVMKRSKRAASIPDTNEAGGVYRRTVHWVKKQEERIKQH